MSFFETFGEGNPQIDPSSFEVFVNQYDCYQFRNTEVDAFKCLLVDGSVHYPSVSQCRLSYM